MRRPSRRSIVLQPRFSTRSERSCCDAISGSAWRTFMRSRVSYYPDQAFSRVLVVRCRSRVLRTQLSLSEKRRQTSPQTQFKKGPADVTSKSSENWVRVRARERSRLSLPGWRPYLPGSKTTLNGGKRVEVRCTCRLRHAARVMSDQLQP